MSGQRACRNGALSGGIDEFPSHRALNGQENIIQRLCLPRYDLGVGQIASMVYMAPHAGHD